MIKIKIIMTIKSCKWCVSQSPYEKIKFTKTLHFHDVSPKLQRTVKLIKVEAFVSFNITLKKNIIQSNYTLLHFYSTYIVY